MTSQRRGPRPSGRPRVGIALAAVLLLTPSATFAEDHFAQASVPAADPSSFDRNLVPTSGVVGPGEAYPVFEGEQVEPGLIPAAASWNIPKVVGVAVRLPEAREAEAWFVAADGAEHRRRTVKLPAAADPTAKGAFLKAKWRYYEHLAARALPGSAWFRHQAAVARAAVPGAMPAVAGPNRAGEPPRDDLERTFDLFGGGRAVSENLQLDRPLLVGPAGNQAVPGVAIAGLPGITVAEIDWKPLIAGKAPKLDALAGRIPADQHALFSPGVGALGAVAREVFSGGFGLARMGMERAEDERLLERYERQLGIGLDGLAKLAAGGKIGAVAMTGSDPFLPTGTDVVLLLESADSKALAESLRQALETARLADPTATAVQGDLGGVGYLGTVNPDRSLSGFVADLGGAVALGNSVQGLKGVVEASTGKVPKLADAPEYTYFRDRYTKGEAAESGLLVLTDATIRRWCGPRWRIGAQRRVRAAAALAEMQAGGMAEIARGQAPAGPFVVPPAAADLDLGTIARTVRGVVSSTYGSVQFLTPIVELPMETVDAREAEAYGRWRDGYQANWRQSFDPIAVRFGLAEGKVSADLTVIPLIVGSDYRPFLQVIGKAEIPPLGADLHPEALVHLAMAFDVESEFIKRQEASVRTMLQGPGGLAFGWLGKSVSFYLDADPFWAELAKAPEAQAFTLANVDRLPVAIRAEVSNPLGLTLFLSALRGFIEQTAPQMTVWSNLEHAGKPYVKVAPAAEAAEMAGPAAKLALYYSASPKSFTITTSEAVIKRVLERAADPDKAKALAEAQGPWLGTGLALRANDGSLRLLDTGFRDKYREAQRVAAWANLPILNEWHRLAPGSDPVELHEAAWGVRLSGGYAWNDGLGTMESTTFGSPSNPKEGPAEVDLLARLRSARLGVSFEGQGLRARAEVDRRPIASP
ncbi:hypothetical protein EP7_000347 [Isosphaeraceae bacterium EP7]